MKDDVFAEYALRAKISKLLGRFRKDALIILKDNGPASWQELDQTRTLIADYADDIIKEIQDVR